MLYLMNWQYCILGMASPDRSSSVRTTFYDWTIVCKVNLDSGAFHEMGFTFLEAYDVFLNSKYTVSLCLALQQVSADCLAT